MIGQAVACSDVSSVQDRDERSAVRESADRLSAVVDLGPAGRKGRVARVGARPVRGGKHLDTQ
jgi:hypothetical protein